MSKEQQTPEAESSETAAQKPAVFRPLGQFVRDFSFECIKAPFEEGNETQHLNLNVGLNIQGSETEHQHEVSVKLKGEAKTDAGETAYIVELEYVGVFEIKDVPQEHMTPLLAIEAPALLFPFARHIVTGMISDAGFKAGTIDPVNFHALFMQEMERRQQQEQAS